MDQLRNQQVLILGLGASGLAMVRWCARWGAQVTVADTRVEPPHGATLAHELPQVKCLCNPMDERLLQHSSFSAIYKSPGLSPANVAPVWKAAQAAGLMVGGEVALFVQALEQLALNRGYRPKVLAVTGTNGKTTVTTLTGLLLERAGLRVAVAGNIGPTLLDTLSARLDQQDLPEVWVLELSSFQLDGLQGFDPNAAVVLNVTQDHLDWHGTHAAYAAAKLAIFGPHTLRLLNRDDPVVYAMGAAGFAVQTFGQDVPRRAGDLGLQSVNGMSWLVRALDPEDGPSKRRADRVAMDSADLLMQRLMPADALRIRGRHNATNALAALALAQFAGASLASMLYGLREYRGEPHRLESLAVIADVEYFDDSKGTNVGATVAALQGLGPERKLVLILGGDGKGQDFAPLAAPVHQYARAVLLIGRDAQALRHALSGTGVPLQDATGLQAAVAQAHTLARAGDAVVLSPACSSLDMFDNYQHRARVFAQAVQELAALEGVA
jgi:UDP-N-acetylmuramoylalanine--D-glutamate ligase